MKRTALIALIAFALVLGLAAYASAANPDTVTVTATVPTVLSLTLNGGDGPVAVNFPIVDPETATAGDTAVTVGVKSNAPFDLNYAAADFAAPGPLSMPVSVMSYSTDGVSYTAFGNTGNIANEGPRGVTNYPYVYSVQPGLTYSPASYSTSIIYTLSVD